MHSHKIIALKEMAVIMASFADESAGPALAPNLPIIPVPELPQGLGHNTKDITTDMDERYAEEDYFEQQQDAFSSFKELNHFQIQDDVDEGIEHDFDYDSDTDPLQEFAWTAFIVHNEVEAYGGNVAWGDFDASAYTGELFDSVAYGDDFVYDSVVVPGGIVGQIADKLGMIVARVRIEENGMLTLLSGANGTEQVASPTAVVSKIHAAVAVVFGGVDNRVKEPNLGLEAGAGSADKTIELTGKELGDFPDTKEGKNALRAAALESMSAAKGEFFPCPALHGEVEVRREGIKKIISISGDSRKLKIINSLPKLILNSEKVGKRLPYNGDKDKSAVAYFTLRSEFILSGAPLAVRFVIKEDNNGKFHYDHSIHDIEVIFDGVARIKTSPTEAGLGYVTTSNGGGTDPSCLASYQLKQSLAHDSKSIKHDFIVDSVGSGKMVLNLFIEGEEQEVIDEQSNTESAITVWDRKDTDTTKNLEIFTKGGKFWANWSGTMKAFDTMEDARDQVGYWAYDLGIDDVFGENKANISDKFSVHDIAYLQDIRDENKRIPVSFRGYMDGGKAMIVMSGSQFAVETDRLFKYDLPAIPEVTLPDPAPEPLPTITGNTEIDRYKSKLLGLQNLQERMKAVNKIVNNKKLTSEQKKSALTDAGYTGNIVMVDAAPRWSNGKLGYESYELSNNNANIASTKKRIAQLEAQDLAAAKASSGDSETRFDFEGGTIELDYSADRLKVDFDVKPGSEMTSKLKQNGFKYSYTNEAWQRQLTDNAISTANYLFGTKIKTAATMMTEEENAPRPNPIVPAVEVGDLVDPIKAAFEIELKELESATDEHLLDKQLDDVMERIGLVSSLEISTSINNQAPSVYSVLLTKSSSSEGFGKVKYCPSHHSSIAS